MDQVCGSGSLASVEAFGNGPANWRAPARPINERGLFHTIKNTTIYLRRTADDDNASRFGLQTEYQFHRRARIDTLCDTNNKAAKFIARNIFFAKARDNDGRSWKELLQQLPGGSQVTYIDKDDEVGGPFAVFFSVKLIRDSRKMFSRKP